MTDVRRSGSVEVICGPMFSSKTETLIHRLRRAQIARRRVQAFKPSIDRRYHTTHLASHGAQSFEALAVADCDGLAAAVLKDTQVVGIDEAQFFGHALVPLVQSLADRGVRVIVAGLDQDYRGEPFDPIPQLLAIAETFVKLDAVCSVCGGAATRSYRIAAGNEIVQVGAADAYEARCRACYKDGARSR